MDTGKNFFEIRYDPRKGTSKADRKDITSQHEDYPGTKKSWTTYAAAEAAIDHFRAWVDGGRRKQTATATAARQPAAGYAAVQSEPYTRVCMCMYKHMYKCLVLLLCSKYNLVTARRDRQSAEFLSSQLQV